MARISFIGLGNMGAPMSINLIKSGHDLSVFDVFAQSMESVVAEGAHAAKSAVESAQNVDFIFSMLPGGKHVKDLYLGQSGLLKSIAGSKTVVIDSSTIETETAKLIASYAIENGCSFVDAPVSGGVGGAKAGTLAFMVGGCDKDYQLVKPILECMGKNIFHAGDIGAGQSAKACNNMLLGIMMAGTAEVLNMGNRIGLDPSTLSDIMKNSTGSNWALQSYNPAPGVMDNVPSSNNYAGGFRVDLMHKDLGLAMELSRSSESPTPLGSNAYALYSLHKSKGAGGLDFSSILELYLDNKTD